MIDASGIAESLEAVVNDLSVAGLVWAQENLKAAQLEEDKKSFLAAIQNELRALNTHKDITEKELERLALADVRFRSFIRAMCEARAAALRAKVKYDNLEKLYEARRSLLSMEKAKLEKGVSHIGR